MYDNEVTHNHEDGREPSSQPVPPETTARHEVERPAGERDRDAERVDAVPVIDQPAGDALPPDVAGHDD